MELKKFTRLSMLLALSVVLNILESFIPFLDGSIPGIKIGLANIVILFTLYYYSFKDALYVSIIRVFLVGILRTGLFSLSFFFSLSGAFLSIIVMFLAKKITRLSIIGVSILGSISHSIGQIIIAVFIVQNTNVIYYLPWILLFSIPSGILVGFASKELFHQISKKVDQTAFQIK